MKQPPREGESPATGLAPEAAVLMDNARRASAFLKSLSHENRLMILCLLAQKECSVSELEARLGLRQPTVSQQLSRLRLDGMVATRREGKAVLYSIASPEVREMIGLLYRLFCSGGGC